jgi:hypothetical protein
VPEVVGGWQGEVQLEHLVQFDSSALRIETEHMAPGVERIRAEVQVESWDTNVSQKLGREKAH